MSPTNVIIVELDDPITIRAGAITFDTFVLMLNCLIDSTSYFHRWYTKINKIKNPEAQYQQLQGSLYFNKPLNAIHQKLKQTIRMYNTLLSKHEALSQKTISMIPQKIQFHIPTSLAMQTGSGGPNTKVTAMISNSDSDDEDDDIPVKTFITKCMIYITNSQWTDPDNIPIVDVFTNIFTIYQQNRHKIDIYQTYTASPDTIAELSYYNCDLAIRKLIAYQSNLPQNGDRALIINHSIEYLIQSAPQTIGNQKQAILRNMKKLLLSGGVNRADPEFLRTLQDRYSIHLARMQDLFRQLVMSMSDEIKSESEQKIIAANKEREINEKIKQIREKASQMNITVVPPQPSIGEVKKWYDEEQTRLIDLGYRSATSAVELSMLSIGNWEDRTIFLIKQMQTDADSYVIKISTDAKPLYKMEGYIYQRFKQIIDDPKEKNGYVAKHIIRPYSFKTIPQVSSNTILDIYLTDDKSIIATPTVNEQLYNAIMILADTHGTNSVYYYTTENLLGKGWNTLNGCEATLNNDQICQLTIDVFRLLTYLNKRYHFIHGDLHRSNIFVEVANTANFKIFDFNFSEIASSDDSDFDTSTNNAVFDLMLNDANVMRNLKRTVRDNIGLIYDIYYVFRYFATDPYETCGNADLIFLNEKREEKHKQLVKNYPQLDEWDRNHIQYYFMLIALNSDQSLADEIRERFALKQDGGSFYQKKYYKYKYKYLKLINSLSDQSLSFKRGSDE